MASDSLDDVVLAALRAVAGPERGSAGLPAALDDAAREIAGLRAANRALAEVVESNTRAVTRRPAGASDGDSGRSAAGTIASAVFGSGLGLAPLASAIVGLFRRDRREPPPPLIEYVAPERLRLEVANPESANAGITGFPSVSRGQDGLARAVDARPQISISVNAMDSRSFLDHSHEIAQAVRQAMLDSHALNDVVSDL
jgi:hypothetical protein